MEGASSLTAVNHYVALLYLADGQLDEAQTLSALGFDKASRTRRMAYGMALLMTVAKRQHDEDTAIAVGTERWNSSSR